MGRRGEGEAGGEKGRRGRVRERLMMRRDEAKAKRGGMSKTEEDKEKGRGIEVEGIDWKSEGDDEGE